MNKESHRFKLYINSQNKKVWEIIEYAENKGLNVSSYLCSKIIQAYEEDFRHPMSEPSNPMVIPEKNHLVKTLVDIAKEYDEAGFDGLDMTYVLPHMFIKSELSREDMTSLAIFILKMYVTVVCTTEIRDIIVSHPEKFPNVKKDVVSKYRFNEFKKLLNLELLDDIDRKILFEEQKKKEEMEERNKKIAFHNRQKIEIEKLQWEMENPGKKYWMKGMTDEEIDISNKLLSGELEIAEDGTFDDS